MIENWYGCDFEGNNNYSSMRSIKPILISFDSKSLTGQVRSRE